MCQLPGSRAHTHTQTPATVPVVWALLLCVLTFCPVAHPTHFCYAQCTAHLCKAPTGTVQGGMARLAEEP